MIQLITPDHRPAAWIFWVLLGLAVIHLMFAQYMLFVARRHLKACRKLEEEGDKLFADIKRLHKELT